MIDQLNTYNYSKQYIFLEQEDKKIHKKLKSDVDIINVDDYIWNIVTTITQSEIDGYIYYLLQHEDKELGWCHLEDSIQIYRFPARHYQVIEERFTANELNKKMNIDKDFISHFKGKLLTVKSQVFYEDEIYYSVFIKNKFHGFHSSNVLDKLLECDIELDPKEVQNNTDLHKVSSLTKPVSDVEIDNIKLISLFKENEIGKVKVNGKETYWISTKNIDVDKTSVKKDKEPSLEELMIDDLFYSVNLERNKSKDIVKTVLAAKNYLNNKKGTKKKNIDSTFLNERNEGEEIKEKYEELQNSYTELNHQFKRAQSEQKLEQQRLEQQLDYKKRLEDQKDKYKNRMEFVEDKLKKLDEKYKQLRRKYEEK